MVYMQQAIACILKHVPPKLASACALCSPRYNNQASMHADSSSQPGLATQRLLAASLGSPTTVLTSALIKVQPSDFANAPITPLLLPITPRTACC
jgi:hypothetical protein